MFNSAMDKSKGTERERDREMEERKRNPSMSSFSMLTPIQRDRGDLKGESQLSLTKIPINTTFPTTITRDRGKSC